MANFKASSGFVLGTTVLLLLVAISIYGAHVATACDKVMLFNSSSLEVVEQVSKDQGITEFAAIDYHEIQRRVLQGRIAGEAGELVNELTDLFGDTLRSKVTKTIDQAPERLTPKFKNNLNNYCMKACDRSKFCACKDQENKTVLQFAKKFKYCGLYTIDYCWDTTYSTTGENSYVCCEAPSLINSNQPSIDQTYNNRPPPLFYSGSPPLFYSGSVNAVMTVIAIFTIVS